MDVTTAQSTVDAAQADVDADNKKLNSDMATLQDAKDALANITLINQLEALTADQVSEINEALANDPANSTGITLALTPITVDHAPLSE